MTEIEIFWAKCAQKWKLQELANLVEEFEKQIMTYALDHDVQVGNNYESIVFFTAQKAALTMKEIITLCNHGYSDGAMALARNVYEQSVTLLFFKIKKIQGTNIQTYIDNYSIDYTIKRSKILRDYYEFVVSDAVKKAQYTSEYENAKQKATDYKNREYWWINEGSNDFRSMVDYTIDNSPDKLKLLLHYLHFLYKRACTAIHASCMGNMLRLGADDTIDTYPNNLGQSTPLFFSATSFGFICDLINKEWNLKLDEMLIQLESLSEYYQKENMGDKKQCPTNQQ